MLYRIKKDYNARYTEEMIRYDHSTRVNKGLSDKFIEKECKIGLMFCSKEYGSICTKNKDGSWAVVVFNLLDKDDLQRFKNYLKRKKA